MVTRNGSEGSLDFRTTAYENNEHLYSNTNKMNVYYRKFNNRFEEITHTSPLICSTVYIFAMYDLFSTFIYLCLINICIYVFIHFRYMYY